MFKFLAVLLISTGLANVSHAQTASQEGLVKTHDGYKLFYEKVGNGKQVIIIPARLFTEDLKALATPQRTLIMYDMRNRGKSERVPEESAITIDNDVRDLETVRGHFNVEKFSPIGYSYLGMMVMLYAKDHPTRVERIVQLGPVPLKFGTQYPKEQDNTGDRSVFDEERLRKLRELQKENFHEKNPREYCEQEWAFSRVGLVAEPPKNVDRLQSACSMENEWPVNVRRHLKAHFEGSVQKLNVPWENVTRKVTHPVLTIHGVKDRNAPYGAGREWALKLKNARLISIPDAAHQSWADRSELVLTSIDEFLKGGWPKAAEKVHH